MRVARLDVSKNDLGPRGMLALATWINECSGHVCETTESCSLTTTTEEQGTSIISEELSTPKIDDGTEPPKDKAEDKQ